MFWETASCRFQVSANLHNQWGRLCKLANQRAGGVAIVFVEFFISLAKQFSHWKNKPLVKVWYTNIIEIHDFYLSDVAHGKSFINKWYLIIILIIKNKSITTD